MDTSLDEIIKKYSSQTDSSITGIDYTKLLGQKKKFSVIPQWMGNFLGDFCDMCQDDIDLERTRFDEQDEEEEEDPTMLSFSGIGHSVCEVISKRTIPVIVRMKLPFILDLEQRRFPNLYGQNFISKVVWTIQNVLINKLFITSERELVTVVEESKLWSTEPPPKGITYSNLKFTFPYCQVDVNYQRRKLTPTIVEALRQMKVMAELNIQPTSDWPAIVQPITDFIPLYRGKIEEMAAPMLLSQILGHITDDHLARDAVRELPLSLEIFNPQEFQYVKNNAIPMEFLSKEVDLDHWLPLFLSIHFCQIETRVREIEMEDAPEDKVEYDDTATLKNPHIMIRNLLPILSPSRFDIEPTWKEIGQILYNVFVGTDEGLDIFCEYSAKATNPIRDKEMCTRFYRSCTRNHLSVKTIAWYARKDNRKAYEHWHNHWSKPALFESMSLVHSDVAEAVYRIFWLNHVWVGGSRWYFFDEHRLKEQRDEIDIHRDITETLVPIYKEMRKQFSIVSNDSVTTASDRKQAEATIKQITSLIDKLGNQSFKSSVIRACRQLFEIKDFDRIKDSDPAKMGWSNCVVVCAGNHAYAVDGKLEDFITKSTFCPYRPDLHWGHPLVLRLLDWTNKIFPDRDLHHYVLKDVSSFLWGRNAEKLLRTWCGDGNNSKTMFAKCIQAWLGLYCVDFPPNFLTGKQMGTSGPNPELAQANGAHVGFIPETEDDEKIREGTAKRITGGDRQFARMCNENGGPMEMMAKTILMCNKIPEFTTISKALQNRFIYIPFLSTWSNDAPDDVEEQKRTKTFKNDPYFEEQIPELCQALGWVAVQYYYYYKTEGLVQPQIVTEYTTRHWEENDPMVSFVAEKLQQVYLDPINKIVDTTQSLCASEIYPVFRSWFSQNYPGIQVVSQIVFKSQLQRRIGPQGSLKRWYGIRLVQAPTMLPTETAGGAHVPMTAQI
jgi:hypothetical protein